MRPRRAPPRPFRAARVAPREQGAPPHRSVAGTLKCAQNSRLRVEVERLSDQLSDMAVRNTPRGVAVRRFLGRPARECTQITQCKYSEYPRASLPPPAHAPLAQVRRGSSARADEDAAVAHEMQRLAEENERLRDAQVLTLGTLSTHAGYSEYSRWVL
jgi:hypothetical protein